MLVVAPSLTLIINGAAILIALFIVIIAMRAGRLYRLALGDPDIQGPTMRTILRALVALLAISFITALLNIFVL